MSFQVPRGPAATHRERAPHERPRAHNDPGKQDGPSSHYQRSAKGWIIPVAISAAVLIAVFAGVGFVVFNLVFA